MTAPPWADAEWSPFGVALATPPARSLVTPRPNRRRRSPARARLFGRQADPPQPSIATRARPVVAAHRPHRGRVTTRRRVRVRHSERGHRGMTTTDTAPRYLFAGDWPADSRGGLDELTAPHRTGVGPMRIDELCPSCGGPISTTGECKCS